MAGRYAWGAPLNRSPVRARRPHDSHSGPQDVGVGLKHALRRERASLAPVADRRAWGTLLDGTSFRAHCGAVLTTEASGATGVAGDTLRTPSADRTPAEGCMCDWQLGLHRWLVARSRTTGTPRTNRCPGERPPHQRPLNKLLGTTTLSRATQRDWMHPPWLGVLASMAARMLHHAHRHSSCCTSGTRTHADTSNRTTAAPLDGPLRFTIPHGSSAEARSSTCDRRARLRCAARVRHIDAMHPMLGP